MQAIGCLTEDSILLSVLHSFIRFSGVNSAIGIYLFTYINCLRWYEIQEQTICYFNTCIFQGDVLVQVFQIGIGSSMVDVVAPLFFLKRMAY